MPTQWSKLARSVAWIGRKFFRGKRRRSVLIGVLGEALSIAPSRWDADRSRFSGHDGAGLHGCWIVLITGSNPALATTFKIRPSLRGLDCLWAASFRPLDFGVCLMLRLRRVRVQSHHGLRHPRRVGELLDAPDLAAFEPSHMPWSASRPRVCHRVAALEADGGSRMPAAARADSSHQAPSVGRDHGVSQRRSRRRPDRPARPPTRPARQKNLA